MITLGPLKDRNKAQKLFLEHNIDFNDNRNCLTAFDGKEIIGLSFYELDKEKMVILAIEPTNDLSLADGILRSTLHIAAERSVMCAFYADTVSEEFLNKLGFIKNKEEKTLDIDKLFKSCCSCK